MNNYLLGNQIEGFINYIFSEIYKLESKNDNEIQNKID